MSDARLDLEVVINGTQYVAKGLDDIADASRRVGSSASATSSQTKVLTSAITGLSQGASAANAAQSAFANLMEGNFVGAFRAATVAVKGLWTAMLSNPVTALIAGITALAAAGYAMATMHERAAEAAREQARAEKELLDEAARIKHTDSVSVHQEIAKSAVNKGDMETLEKMRNKLREVVAEQEKLVTVWGFSTDKLQEAQAHLDVYNNAIDELAKRTADAAAETSDALSKIAEDQANADQESLESAIAASAAQLELEEKQAQERIDKKAEMTKELANIEKQLAAEELDILKEKAAQSAALFEAEQGKANAAMQEFLNPGSAKKAAYDAEQDRKREQNRIAARLSGNSVEARLAAKNLDAAQFAALDALDNNIRDQDALKSFQEAHPEVQKLEQIKTAIDSLRSDLTGVRA